ncbi:hypothetical protein GCM10023144_30080 [Pigmentiphaga soli]|uniref:Nucleotide sugar aminotransferase n=1 Tax=Pigmentiphaga soli TaxID=1007095 RepID=A0ABP8H912_9BURK
MAAADPAPSQPVHGTVPPTAGLPLRAGDLLPGNVRLDAALAHFLGVESTQIACSGTAAFVAALTALSRLSPERDTVIVPAYTCPLMALAVAHCGLRLALCDLRAGSPDLDPAHLQSLCDTRTLAVVPTHLAGRVADVASALRIARAAGAWVVEDAAQALGARVGGRSVGLQGDIGFFSLAVGKGLTIFEGGVLLARDPELREACAAALREQARPASWRRRLAGHAWDLRRSVELLGYWALYRPGPLGWAYLRPLRHALEQGDWVAAAGDDFGAYIPLHGVGRWRRGVGARALARLPDFLERTRARALRRIARLARIPGVRVLGDSPAAEGAAGTWPVLLVTMPTAHSRDALLREGWGAGDGLGLPFAHALADYAAYRHAVPRAAPGELPHARDLASRLLSISNSPWLDDARFHAVCEAVEACADRRGTAARSHA